MAEVSENKTSMKSTAKASQKPRRSPKLTPKYLQLEEHARNTWVATLEAHFKYEDALHPAFWTHIASKLGPFDKICLRAEDGRFYAELLVVMAGANDAVVKELLYLDIDAKHQPAPIDMRDYLVKWGGPHAKWRVIRKEDGAVLRDGFPQSERAQQWLADHIKAIS